MRVPVTEELGLVLEAAIFASPEPLKFAELRRLFDADTAPALVRDALVELQMRWMDRGVELVEVADGWRFQTRAAMQPWLARIKPDKPPRYSRAVLETLAIIAYHQPVTRGDIEAIRGVAVNPAIIRGLEEREWIESVGHREVPGRPALFATTAHFLSDLGLKSLAELPPLEALGELEHAGVAGLPDADSGGLETDGVDTDVARADAAASTAAGSFAADTQASSDLPRLVALPESASPPSTPPRAVIEIARADPETA
jgi:segregation and condensation protein B